MIRRTRPSDQVTQLSTLVFLLALGPACEISVAEGPCETSAQCLAQEVCVDGTCRLACNTNADCEASRSCQHGACLPGVDAGAVEDAGANTDRAAPDSAALDVGNPDIGSPDTSSPDGGVLDSGVLDSGVLDVGRPDTGGPDQGGEDIECSGVVCDNTCYADGECCVDRNCDHPFNQYCVNHICTPCDTCTCPSGQHDGGTGVCVPEGTCFPGYLQAYSDGDGDGLGVEPALEGCYPEALPEGLASVGGDCDDGDPDLFIEITAYPDLDGDGYTGAAEVLCVGVDLPPGYYDAASPPPWVSFEAASAYQIESGDDDWDSETDALYLDTDEARCEIRHENPCQVLVVEDFDLRVPVDATVLGVAVHVQRRADYDRCDVLEDITAQLAWAGVPTGANLAQAGVPWSASWQEVVYGGPDDLWGLSLTAAEVNDPGFGFAYSGHCADNGDKDRLEVDHIWVEVFTDQATDCDEGDVSVWSERDGYVDGDQDRYTIGEPLPLCMGAGLLAGHSQRSLGEDCYDQNDLANPGATAYRGTDRGDGSFDYDCDGFESKQNIIEDLGCSCPSLLCLATSTNSFTPSTDCGSENAVGDCTGTCASCALGSRSAATSCR